jgi:sigma-B regulation protein RsbU (phosphoserine phosphatase)
MEDTAERKVDECAHAMLERSASATILKRVPIFATLPQPELERLATELLPVATGPGSLLFREGEPGDYCLVIVEGELEIVKALDSGDERILGVRGPGELVGEMSLIGEDTHRTASVRARTPVHLLTISRVVFEALLQRQPALAAHMVRTLVNRLRESDSDTIRDLQEHNRRLQIAYHDLEVAQAQLIEKETLERELQVARQIQESMLPQTLPVLENFDFGARMIPARAVGGDFFDLFALDATRVGIVIGDVSGKGVPAALFMALTRSLVRAEAVRAATPGEALQRVNHHLLEMNAAQMFVTVLYAVLDGSTGMVEYARAGHELPLLLDATGTPQHINPGEGNPLGLFETPRLDEQTVALPAGYSFVLYTDGVSDALDPAGGFFGLDGLHTALVSGSLDCAEVIIDAVINAVVHHQGSAPQFDDVTLVAVCHTA